MVLIGDFETTVFDQQEYTEVWASALVQLGTEDVKIFHSLPETWEYIKTLQNHIIIYYHNLKFDGAFWLDFLINTLGFKQGFNKIGDSAFSLEAMRDKDMPNNTFKYVISDMGQWYSITIKQGGRTIELRDSLKLLPFSVEKIGKSFGTKHKKLDMEYKGLRYAGCPITDEEKKYIANDVLVVKEALEIMFSEGHKELTIGACCLKEFRSHYTDSEYDLTFPNLYEMPLNKEEYGSENIGQYINRSYHGGWCYLAKGKEGYHENGLTADVNSLYPSMMSGESGNYYPVGKPTFWKGKPDRFLIAELAEPYRYYFIRVRTRFYLRNGFLPTVQIKNNLLYKGTEWLETSDVYHDGKYHKFIRDKDGNLKPTTVELTLTKTDWLLLQEHYILKDLEYLDGCYFGAQKGIFDCYISKYKQQKLTSTGARRELAKLYLNNLYGKMAASTNSSFKYAISNNGVIRFVDITEYKKKPGYIPIGSAITSYARNFTIRTAQKNYHGKNKRGFIYADTDSIHCDLSPEELNDVPVHDKDFCHWKLESSWDTAYFTRQKTYIEHTIAENLTPCEPAYTIKCAGMPERSKALFLTCLLGKLTGKLKDNYKEIPEEWQEFLFGENIKNIENYTLEELEEKIVPRTVEDFKVGLRVPAKLMPRRIKGGIVLVDTMYEMR